MRALASWFGEWKWPVVILSVLAVMIWIDGKDEAERRAFEIAVMEQHKSTHQEQERLTARLEAYTDEKTKDRFTGNDAIEMESRIMSIVATMAGDNE